MKCRAPMHGCVSWKSAATSICRTRVLGPCSTPSSTPVSSACESEREERGEEERVAAERCWEARLHLSPTNCRAPQTCHRRVADQAGGTWDRWWVCQTPADWYCQQHTVRNDCRAIVRACTESNVESILQIGLQPSKRSSTVAGQRYGKGDYFGAQVGLLQIAHVSHARVSDAFTCRFHC